eukprot:g5319.t1
MRKGRSSSHGESDGFFLLDELDRVLKDISLLRRDIDSVLLLSDDQVPLASSSSSSSSSTNTRSATIANRRLPMHVLHPLKTSQMAIQDIERRMHGTLARLFGSRDGESEDGVDDARINNDHVFSTPTLHEILRGVFARLSKTEHVGRVALDEAARVAPELFSASSRFYAASSAFVSGSYVVNGQREKIGLQHVQQDITFVVRGSRSIDLFRSVKSILQRVSNANILVGGENGATWLRSSNSPSLSLDASVVRVVDSDASSLRSMLNIVQTPYALVLDSTSAFGKPGGSSSTKKSRKNPQGGGGRRGVALLLESTSKNLVESLRELYDFREKSSGPVMIAPTYYHVSAAATARTASSNAFFWSESFENAKTRSFSSKSSRRSCIAYDRGANDDVWALTLIDGSASGTTTATEASSKLKGGRGVRYGNDNKNRGALSSSSLSSSSCKISTGGALLLDMAKVRHLGGWGVVDTTLNDDVNDADERESSSSFELETLDLALRAEEEAATDVTAITHPTKWGASFKVRVETSTDTDGEDVETIMPSLFHISPALDRVRGSDTHTTASDDVEPTRDSRRNDDDDDDDDVLRERLDRFVAFGSARGVRTIVGTNGHNLNVGCTLRTPRCPFHSKAYNRARKSQVGDDKNHHHHDHSFDEYELPPCCKRKLMETLQYVGDLFTETGIAHWIDYRTLIHSAVPSTTQSKRHANDNDADIRHDDDEDVESAIDFLVGLQGGSSRSRHAAAAASSSFDTAQCRPNGGVSSFTDGDVGVMQPDIVGIVDLGSRIEADGYYLRRTGENELRIFASPKNGIHVVVRGYYLTERQNLVDISNSDRLENDEHYSEEAAAASALAKIVPLRYLKPIVLRRLSDGRGGTFTIAAPNHASDLTLSRFGDVAASSWTPPASIRNQPFGRTPYDFTEYAATSTGGSL